MVTMFENNELLVCQLEHVTSLELRQLIIFKKCDI